MFHRVHSWFNYPQLPRKIAAYQRVACATFGRQSVGSGGRRLLKRICLLSDDQTEVLLCCPSIESLVATVRQWSDPERRSDFPEWSAEFNDIRILLPSALEPHVLTPHPPRSRSCRATGSSRERALQEKDTLIITASVPTFSPVPPPRGT